MVVVVLVVVVVAVWELAVVAVAVFVAMVIVMESYCRVGVGNIEGVGGIWVAAGIRMTVVDAVVAMVAGASR